MNVLIKSLIIVVLIKVLDSNNALQNPLFSLGCHLHNLNEVHWLLVRQPLGYW